MVETTVYYSRLGAMIGEFPLYYVGNPTTPQQAEKYFCGVYCANKHLLNKKVLRQE